MSAAHLSADKPNGLVPQDAALADYLDGLLKDDEAHEPSYPTVKLAIVAAQPLPSVRPASKQPQSKMPNAFTDDAEVAETPVPHAFVHANDLTLEMLQGETVGLQPSSNTDVGVQALSTQTELDSAQIAEADHNLAGSLESALLPQVQQASPHPISHELSSPSVSQWRIFSAGTIKIAIARTAIKHILVDAPLQPIAGAPPSVAGMIELEGRARMVLSLPDWLGRQKLTNTILTFGMQGLWGLNVGAEVCNVIWNDAQTIWREAGERNPARLGFMGFNQPAGLVFIDPSELRALFTLTR
jgi:chemotaxis signal transduction protein